MHRYYLLEFYPIPPSTQIDYRTSDAEAIGYAIDYAATYNGVDVINISIAAQNSNGMPLTYDSFLRNKVATAIANGKIVVIGAGNTGATIDDSSTNWNSWDVGEIIVGGSYIDTTGPKKSMAWVGGAPFYGGTRFATSSARIDLVAGAKDIFTKTYNPATSDRFMGRLDGTSFAAPQVAAAAGLIKKIIDSNGGMTLTSKKARDILTMSSSIGRFDGGYPSSPYAETKFLGRDLDISSRNPYLEVSLRSLNLYNALVVANNLVSYQAIVRAFNIDDQVWASINSDWSNGYIQGSPNGVYGDDTIYGLSGLSNGSYLSFATCNGGGGYSHGYQVMNAVKAKSSSYSNAYWDEYIGGLSGFVGAVDNLQPGSTCLAYSNFLYSN